MNKTNDNDFCLLKDLKINTNHLSVKQFIHIFKSRSLECENCNFDHSNINSKENYKFTCLRTKTTKLFSIPELIFLNIIK